MEFLWRPHMKHIGSNSQLFTHIFYDFDMSPFDLDVQDPPQQPQNGTEYKYEIDREEWDRYWNNGTDFNDWWWGNDTYDNDTSWGGDEDDWWNWTNETDTEEEDHEDLPDIDFDDDFFNITNDFLNNTNSSQSNSTNTTRRVAMKRMLREQAGKKWRLEQ